MGSPAIDVAAAEKTYPNGTRALAGVDLKVQEGELVTLLGPSGCGKSTLLRMIAGLIRPTRGQINLWDGAVDAVEAGGHRLAFVFQSPTLMPWASVHRNVRLPLDLRGVAREAADAATTASLERVGLEGFAKSYPRELSGGMQMRVSIARALATDPTLLLMDEPFGALDEITRNRLDGDLLALRQRQRLTIVFVTHSIYEAVFLSNRVAVMATRPGRVVGEVTIDVPYPRTPEFRVSAQFAACAERLQQALQRASATEPA